MKDGDELPWKESDERFERDQKLLWLSFYDFVVTTVLVGGMTILAVCYIVK